MVIQDGLRNCYQLTLYRVIRDGNQFIAIFCFTWLCRMVYHFVTKHRFTWLSRMVYQNATKHRFTWLSRTVYQITTISTFPGNQGLLSVLLPYTALPYTDIILCLYLVVQNGVTLCREDQLVEPPDLLQVLLPVYLYDQ